MFFTISETHKRLLLTSMFFMLLMTEKPEQLKQKTFTLQISNAIVMATGKVRNFCDNLAHYTAMNFLFLSGYKAVLLLLALTCKYTTQIQLCNLAIEQ